MADSTLQDIYDNRDELIATAKKLLVSHKEAQPYEMDWWHLVKIGETEIDLNVFDWETDDDIPIVIVTAHPVTWDDSGYGNTDFDNYVRLVTQMYDTITEEI